MTRLNPEKNELNCKLIYYGPEQAGKTSNLAAIEEHLRAKRGPAADLVAEASELEQDRRFEYVKMPLGRFGTLELRLHIYAVPERAIGRQEALRRMILRDLDGVVFVADSSRHVLAANLHALRCLEEDLHRQGLDPAKVPVVFQWNKRDSPNAVAVSELDGLLNGHRRPGIEAQAVIGKGVFSTLKTAARESLDEFAKRNNLDVRETRRLSREEVAAAIKVARRRELERADPKPRRRRPITREIRREGFEVQGVRTGPLARIKALLSKLQAASFL